MKFFVKKISYGNEMIVMEYISYMKIHNMSDVGVYVLSILTYIFTL